MCATGAAGRKAGVKDMIDSGWDVGTEDGGDVGKWTGEIRIGDD